MAKGRKEKGEKRDRDAASYYKLHTRAVDDLIHADESNSPPVSEEELRKYRSGSRLKLSDTLKAVLIKLWFAGAVCFFILWGLGTYVTAQLDMMLILGIALGVVKDLLENNVFRFFAKEEGDNDRWMMFPQKKYATFFLNILYSYVILLCVFLTYNLINIVILKITGDSSGTVPLGVEPILFGTFCMAFDLLFIGMKRLLRRIVSDARKNTELKP